MSERTVLMRDRELLRDVSKYPCAACPPLPLEEANWIFENMDQAPRRCDPHHVTTVGAGGRDVPENVMPLCREHHNEWHRIGGRDMADKYLGVLVWLQNAGRSDVLEKK